MAAISEITIDGFKAFPEEFTLTLAGKNLLMYGENGSGKSSIYYALHCLLQSQCNSKAEDYFDTRKSTESLVNIDTNKTDAYVEVKFAGSNVGYRLSKMGYKESVPQQISPLKDLNGECVFINHQFLSHISRFRNSQYIDLFPVFIKDILPFALTQDKSHFISQIYDDVMKGIERHGRGGRVEPSYDKKILSFNEETVHIIDLINVNATHTATKLYNDYFRNAGDNKLSISLKYENNLDKIPITGKSYWLRYGYIWNQETTANGDPKEVKISTKKVLQKPVIALHVDEVLNDGTIRNIEKPQTYFNEAKLTAILLSIRFALLDYITAPNGRFIALDDMLISLDMSNRKKVADFLLEISSKYNIYMFTHDQSLFNYLMMRVKQNKNEKRWSFQKVYKKNENIPTIINEDLDYISKAKRFFEITDYESSGIYLRKALEQKVAELLPFELKSRADGGFNELQTLWKKLLDFYSANGNNIDKEVKNNFYNSKLLILNPSAHFQKLSMPIFKNELMTAFSIYDSISQLDKIEKELIVEGGKMFEFVYPLKSYKCTFVIDRDLIIIEGDRLISVMPKCRNIEWEYEGTKFYDFNTKEQNLDHPLKMATPKFDKFIIGLTKLPLSITEELFLKECNIDGVPLNEYMNKNISSIILESTKV